MFQNCPGEVWPLPFVDNSSRRYIHLFTSLHAFEDLFRQYLCLCTIWVSTRSVLVKIDLSTLLVEFWYTSPPEKVMHFQRLRMVVCRNDVGWQDDLIRHATTDKMMQRAMRCFLIPSCQVLAEKLWFIFKCETILMACLRHWSHCQARMTETSTSHLRCGRHSLAVLKRRNGHTERHPVGVLQCWTELGLLFLCCFTHVILGAGSRLDWSLHSKQKSDSLMMWFWGCSGGMKGQASPSSHPSSCASD